MAVLKDLTIIIVSWNVEELLRRCLTSIYSSLTASTLVAETFVVDNASSDGSAGIVEAEFPWVHLIRNDQNRGFAAACNQVLGVCKSRFIVLLNPDTEVLGNSLETMVNWLDHNPGVAALGPRILWPDGSTQSSRRRFPTIATAFMESTILQRFFPHHRVIQRYCMEDHPDDIVQEVDWVVGACLVVRREVVDQIGLLDEQFYIYSEELDWCRRMRTAGWKVFYLPQAQVVHYGAKSSEQDLASQNFYFHDSKCKYFAKYHGLLLSLALRKFIFVSYVFMTLEEAFKLLIGHKPALRRERLALFSRVLRWQLGLRG